MYTRAVSTAAATVIDAQSFDMPFVVENVSYYLATDDPDEAWYLCAFLNADAPNEIIKPFQSQGLFGARDIHKKILEIPFPKFDGNNAAHKKIASLAEDTGQKVAEYLATKNFDEHDNNMTSHECGRFRNEVRNVIASELRKLRKKSANC